MLELTKGNIRTITETIDKAEITFSHLRDDLIDHICCEVENIMQQGVDFQNAFVEIKKSFGVKDLQKVQEQTLLLIDKNYRIMKKTMKVSGVLSTSLLMFGSLFKINHWPGAGLILVLGFFILCFLFLPSAYYVMHGENKNQRMIFLYISAFLGSIGFFLGLLFKIMHWPGANILLICGLGVLGIIFLPALLVYLLKTAKNQSEKIIYSIGIIAGVIYLFGFLSKMMQWPGAVLLLTLGSAVLVAIFLPALTVFWYKNEKFVKGSFVYLIAAISWFILFSILISINISRSVINNIVEENRTVQKTIDVLQKQNSMIIEASKNTKRYQAIIEVDSISAYLCNYIEGLKVEIVKALGEENLMAIENVKSVDVTKIRDYSNTYCPFFVLIKEDHKGKAFLLKKMVEDTRLQLLNKVGNDSNTSRMIETLLSTSLPNERPEWAGSWEMLYFAHSSVIGSMNVLSSLQRNVWLAENETISYLLD
jgi:uncharacterized membrane protein (DUF106 family)